MGQRASINLFQVNDAITNRPCNRCIRMALAVQFTCSTRKKKKLMQQPVCLGQFVNAVIGNVIQKYLKDRGSTDKILPLQNATFKLPFTLSIKLLEKPLRENTQYNSSAQIASSHFPLRTLVCLF